jgi:DNA-binding NtrC family response regulator
LSDILEQKKSPQKVVIILEDNEKILKLYLKVLGDYNKKVVTSLSEAFSLLQELKDKGIEPAILIADFHLPDGESGEFVKAAKQQFPKMKVILTSSDENAEVCVEHDVSIGKGEIFKIKSKIDEYLSAK